MNINVLEIYKSTSDVIDRFIVIEKVSHIIYIILFLFLLILGNSLVSFLNKKIDHIKNDNELNSREYGKELNLYTVYLFLTIAFFIFCFIKIFNHGYNLIECFYNPQYVYLKQLINLMK